MNGVIDECIVNFGRPPRSFSLLERWRYLRLEKPRWLRSNRQDKLNVIFQHAAHLFRFGSVTWGHIIQANALIFEPGRLDVPGAVVFSLEDPRRVTPDFLGAVADELYALKNTQPSDPALRKFADHFTDELDRAFGMPIRRTLSPDVDCLISTIFFTRKHLPGRCLGASFFPIVVNPSEPHVVLPLPEQYWPKDFANWWCSL